MSTDDDDISSLYQQAGSPGPSKKLDDAILTASRDAIRKPAAKGPFNGAWPAFASIAAVVVITIILVPIIKQEEPQPALTQTGSEKASSTESAGEVGLNADRATELKKKALQAPVPASQPALQLQEELLADDLDMPPPASISSRAAKAASVGNTSFAEKEEEQAEPEASVTQRSRMEAADSAPFAILTPEMWEVKISRLIAEGKTEAAKTEIERLRMNYPEHQVDPSLLQLMKSHYE